MKAGYAANNGCIVAESTVAVDFAPVCKDTLYILEGLGTLRMAGQLGLLPRRRLSVDFLPQRFDALLQFRQLAAGAVILSDRGFNLRHLPLDLFQFLLRFVGCFHL